MAKVEIASVKMRKRFISLIAACLVMTSLAACNLPAASRLLKTPQPNTPVLKPDPTADLPSPALSEGTASPVAPVSTATETPSGLEAEVLTPPVTASTSTTPQSTCDRAAPGNPLDISIPDDESMSPGEEFSKTWRLSNTGECTWTESYSVVWFSGQKFDAKLSKPLSEVVPPGQSLDITVDMKAPEGAGTYQSNWKLANEAGVLFGLGPFGDAPFWVRIQVIPLETPTPLPSPVPSQIPTVFPSPAAETVAMGQANLQPEDVIALDSGQVNQGENGDLRYTHREDQSYQLIPLNNAGLAAFSDASPSLPDCQSATVSSEPTSLEEVVAGSIACYRTSSGRPGWLRLLNLQDGTLSIEFQTWATP